MLFLWIAIEKWPKRLFVLNIIEKDTIKLVGLREADFLMDHSSGQMDCKYFVVRAAEDLDLKMSVFIKICRTGVKRTIERCFLSALRKDQILKRPEFAPQ